jgi:hypothetical protein
MQHLVSRPGLVVLTSFLLAGIATPTHAGDPAVPAVRVHAGAQNSAKLGTSVSSAGDVNADGFPDYILGAPGVNSAYIYSGLTGAQLRQIPGEQDSAAFGQAVACAGDVNNDGYDDVIIGDPDMFIGCMPQGGAMVYSGKDGTLLFFPTGLTGWEEFGAAVAGAGDIDNDGFDDFIVGAPLRDPACITKAGGVTVFSGYHGGALFDAIGTEYSQLGSAVAGLGDVTGDGIGDIAVGAAGLKQVFVFNTQNNQIVYTLSGTSIGEFGAAIANAGDVNGDGINDIAVGEPILSIGWMKGNAHVFSGTDGSVLHTWMGSTPGDGFGYSVAPAGDVNADGMADVIVGAPFAKADGKVTGRFEVRSGATGQIIRSLNANPGLTHFGSSVAGIGDLNGDGYSDVIVGAPKSSGNKGSGFVYHGGTNVLGLSPSFSVAASGFLTSAAMGDLNSDGRSDLVTVSPSNDRISIFLSKPDGSYSTAVNKSAGDQPNSVAIGDFDKDGDNDLAVAASKDKKIVIFRNNGAGAMTKRGTIKTGSKPIGIFATDINGDGAADLVLANSNDDNIAIYLNKNQNYPVEKRFKSPKKIAVGDKPIQVIANDVNGDSLSDLLVLNQASSTISVFMNVSGGTFISKPTVPTDGMPIAMVSADFDADGKNDLAWLNQGGNITWRQSFAHALFINPQSFTVDPSATALQASDFDFDGFADLAIARPSDASLSLLMNTQAGSFANEVTVAGSTTCQILPMGDLDSDGDPDMIAPDSTTGQVQVFENLWFD